MMKTEALLPRLAKEGKAIISVASSLTLALYIKRGIQKLVQGKIVPEEVLERGLTTQPEPVSSSTGHGDWFHPPRQHGPVHSGPGRVPVQWAGVYVYYSNKYLTPDGYELYQHDEHLHDGHTEGACPLLKPDICYDCDWFDPNSRNIVWDNNCLAQRWIEECSSSTDVGLDRFAQMSQI